MATPYSKLKKRFLNKINEYNFLILPEEQTDEMIMMYIDGAAGAFERLCKQDLSLRDDELQEFEEDLKPIVINILVEGMISEWLSPYEATSELLEESLMTRDYSNYAPANQLKAVSSVAKRREDKFEAMMINYSYNFGDMDRVGE